MVNTIVPAKIKLLVNSVKFAFRCIYDSDWTASDETVDVNAPDYPFIVDR